MKKSISVLAAAMLLSCTFVSCGSKDDDDKKDGIVGKWTATDETIKEQSEKEGAEITEDWVEFTSDGKITASVVADYSDMFCAEDDKILIMGNEFDYEYDGETLVVRGTDFPRLSSPDENSLYGEYDAIGMYGDDLDPEVNMEAVLKFESAGVSYLSILGVGDYTYDEESGEFTTTIDDEEDEYSKIEIDGDKLTMTDKDGDTEVYTRVK